MNQRNAMKMKRQIHREDLKCRVTAFIENPDGTWAVAVLDTRTGEQFTVRSLAEWTERMDSLDYAVVD